MGRTFRVLGSALARSLAARRLLCDRLRRRSTGRRGAGGLRQPDQRLRRPGRSSTSTSTTFEERDEIAEGLGPVYNAQSCAECHQNPVAGGDQPDHRAARRPFRRHRRLRRPSRRIADQRSRDRRRDPGARAAAATKCGLPHLAQHRSATASSRRSTTARSSPSSSTAQPAGDARPGHPRAGPRGAAGATRGRPLRLEEPAREPALVRGRRLPERDGHHQPVCSRPRTPRSAPPSARRYDTVPDPEDAATAPASPGSDDDIEAFAALHARHQGAAARRGLAATADAIAGSELFDDDRLRHLPHAIDHHRAGRHRRSTAARSLVPAALGNKIIHPFSDFLLHDIGTGDGIVQNGGAGDAQQAAHAAAVGPAHARPSDARRRVADADDAILRHGGEALITTLRFLASEQQPANQLLAFLGSL